MSEPLNPYIAGAPVLESSMFFGREEIFGWIERCLSGKYVDHILVIHGQRRVGKTSVLKQIPNFLGDSYLQVFFDLQGRVSTTLERFLFWMAREMARTLQQQYGLEVPKPDREAFSADAEHLIADYLPDLQTRLDGRVLLLTFDEFDTLAREDIQDSLAKPLIAYLRRLMDVEGLNFIFSIGSSGNKLENMQASYTDFFKTALYRKISFLDRSSCQRLVTRPVQGVIAYDRAAVDRIYEITAGHPYFTQLTCHELFSRCQKTGSREVTPEDVEAVIEDVIERGTVNLKFVWDEASDLEKWILACLAQMEKGAANQQLGDMLREQRVRFVESELNSAVLHLREKDVIAKDNAFIVHLLRLWLQQYRPLDRVREELTEINPIANRFIEIGDEYQDRGDREKAIESYQQALDADPRNLQANLNLGLMYLENGQYQQAIQAFEQVLSLDPDDVASQTGLCESYLSLGKRALSEGDEQAAVGYFQQVLTFNESHTDAREQLAGIYREQAEDYLADGKDDRALSAFKRAMDYVPEDEALTRRYQDLLAEKKAKVINGWLQKAEKALERRQWDAAVDAVEKALEIDPGDEELQNRLAETKDAARQYQLSVYQEQIDRARTAGKWDEAVDVLEKAVQLAPDNPAFEEQLQDARAARRQAELDAYRERAEQALEKQDWEEAVQAYRQASRAAPEDPVWKEKIQEVEEARFQAELDQFRSRADRARDQDAWGEALQALEGYLSLNPSDADVQAEVEELRDRKRQADLADLKTRAEAAEDQERWKEAVNYWEEYLSLEPEDAEQAEEARTRAEKYLGIFEDYQQAQSLIRSRKYSGAVELLQGIIAQDPTYKATSRLLVEAVEARGERKPFWQAAWFYAAAGVIVIAAAGFVFGPRLIQGFSFSGRVDEPSPAPDQTQPGAELIAVESTAVPSQTAAAATPSQTPGADTPEENDIPDAIHAALVYIQDREPSFEDNFSPPGEEWGEFQNGFRVDPAGGSYVHPVSEMVENGVLPVAGAPQNHGSIMTDFPIVSETDLFEAQNFVLEYSYEIESQSVSFLIDGKHGFVIRADKEVEGALGITMSVEDDYIEYYGDDWHEQVNRAGVSGKTKGRVRVVAIDEDVAFYVDDELMVSFKDELDGGNENMIRVSGEAYRILIDDVRFWNLDGVNLTVVPSQTPTPTVEATESPSENLNYVSPVDGMVMIYVPEGEFIMGDEDPDNYCGGDCPEHVVYLDAFWIDQTEVTNAMFLEFANAINLGADGEEYGEFLDSQGEFVPDVPFYKNWEDTWLMSQPGAENLPVTHVTWEGANAYCQYANRRLPTEAQWEKAARGTDGSNYPWGDYWTSGSSREMCAEYINTSECGLGRTVEVGQHEKGMSVYGAYNMAGNVTEWVADTYDPDYYRVSPDSNPKGPPSGPYKAARGQSWRYTNPRVFIRYYFAKAYTSNTLGFRCATIHDLNP